MRKSRQPRCTAADIAAVGAKALKPLDPIRNFG